MRVLLCEFIQSAATIERVARVLRGEDGLEVVGWAARPPFRDPVTRMVEGVPYFDIPQSASGPRGLLGELVSIQFAWDEEENLRFMLDRERDYQNQLDVSQARLELLAYTAEVLETTRPDWVLFSDVPHNAFSYALYLLARQRAVGTLFLKKGPAPHLFCFAETIPDAVLPTVREGRRRMDASAPLSDRSERYLASLRTDYRAAKPSYMANQEKRSKLLGKVRRVAEAPGLLLSQRGARALATTAKRSALSRYYESRTTEPVFGVPYIVVPLHLQPERTTSPEGGPYGQQWLMVQAIAAAVPDGWNVYVREHPSTFRAGPKLVRGRWFYDGLLRIPRVSLVSTSTNIFDLIDSSRCVATVTGTVAFESVARGVPAMVFGSSAFDGCQGILKVREPADVATHVEKLVTGMTVDETAPRDYLRAFEASPRCYLGNIEPGEDVVQYWKSGEPIEGVLQLMLKFAAAAEPQPSHFASAIR